MTLYIMKLSIKGLFVTLSIYDIRYNWHSKHSLSSAIMLNVIMLNVIKLNIIKLNVVAPNTMMVSMVVLNAHFFNKKVFFQCKKFCLISRNCNWFEDYTISNHFKDSFASSDHFPSLKISQSKNILLFWLLLYTEYSQV
jgi:hypothetical protein